MTATKVEGQTLDEERALYGITNAEVVNCTFEGPADGESCLKETRNIRVVDCKFCLRYPLWHVQDGYLLRCTFTDTARASCWYCRNFTMEDVTSNSIKIIRECDNTVIKNCNINSFEFAWYCRGMKIDNLTLHSEYPFLGSRDIEVHGMDLIGKYCFQYTENVHLYNATIDTKDAFWHTKNSVCTDCVFKGEYLAWYSENLKLVRCKIIGTQPLCYAKGLVLEDCEMVDTDLSFELSDVHATIKGDIHSVKNPSSGRIEADHIGRIVLDRETPCEIVCRQGN